MCTAIESCLQLRNLDLSWCEEIMEETTEAMETFIQSGEVLERLKLRHLPLSARCLYLLANHCVNLRVLNLSNVNMCDLQLLSISLRCKLLQELDVSWNSGETILVSRRNFSNRFARYHQYLYTFSSLLLFQLRMCAWL